jgi:polysaccharide pyruvyl transferase WcaK-like protein
VAGPDIEPVALTGAELVKPGGAFAALRRADLVVDIGAGDSFADIYGGKRLRRILWLKMLCHLAGRKLVLAPQTYGPFRKPLSRWLAAASLSRSALVCARDEASTDHLKEMGVSREVIVASDVALRLPGARDPVATARPKVGPNVSGLLMSGGYQGRNDFGLSVDYPSLIRRIIEGFLSHPDAPELHLIGHVFCRHLPVEDDMAALRALHEAYPVTRLAPVFDTPSEAKGYISQMSFFAGARMHACIAAFSSGVATLPMAYSRKFEGLFGALGYAHSVDLCTQSDDAVFDRAMQGFAARDSWAADAKAACDIGLERLDHYEAALRGLMAGALEAKKRPATQRHAAGLSDRLSAE